MAKAAEAVEAAIAGEAKLDAHNETLLERGSCLDPDPPASVFGEAQLAAIP